jgi:hypothetical protein
MKNEEHSTQERFYLFRHTGSGENIQWLVSTDGMFESDKTYCYLTPSTTFLRRCVQFAEPQATNIKGMPKWIYVIGSVTVTVNGQVPLEIVENE